MVYIIDTIGKHSGMHLYDEAFQKVLNADGLQAEVISNFKEQWSHETFRNFYKGSKKNKIFNLIYSLLKFVKFFISNQNKSSWWIYQSYGLRLIDLVFMIPLLLRPKRLIVLIHDFHSITKGNGSVFNSIQKYFYKKIMPCAIVHSDNVKDRVVQSGFTGKIFQVPLFKYLYSLQIKENEIAPDMVGLKKEKDRLVTLFFGSLRKSKGLETALESMKLLPVDVKKKVHLIVAGQDFENLLTEKFMNDYSEISVTYIVRHISDNEMNFLFELADVVLLPYKEIFQSAVLQTTVHHRRPFIASDLEYFRDFLKAYPSFGEIYGRTSIDFATYLTDYQERWTTGAVDHFTEVDLDRYYQADDMKKFLSELSAFIK